MKSVYFLAKGSIKILRLSSASAKQGKSIHKSMYTTENRWEQNN